jgi:outer membrane immunogenic protein
MFRRGLILAVAASTIATGCSAASAADLAVRSRMPVKAAPYVAVYDWTGFYIGGHLGGAWTDEHATYLGTNGLALDPIGTVYSGNRNGFLGGAQAGYNYQMQNFVVGVTGDFSWTDSSVDNATTAAFIPGVTIHTLAKSHWYGTVAGRVGFAVNNVLLYAKGGAAFAEEVYGGYATLGGVNVSTFSNLTSTRQGYVVGAGVEYGFTPNWTAFVEYNYLDFGTRNYTLMDPGTGVTANFDVRDRVNVIKGGVNYKFGGPVVARY